MVHSSDPSMVGMAAGRFGSGRALLWPDRYDGNVDINPSNQFILQAYQWVAIPEPASFVIACGCLMGFLAMRQTRR
jgi:hypothetical protein